jgi:ABC-2 type transport system ATP-binding protein
MERIIEVSNLHKSYGKTTAVEDISLAVQPGEIFGIIGPNGAGKTTLVESMIGLRTPDSGSIRVLGIDPQKEGRALRQRIGIQLQEAVLPDAMKVWEALDLYSTFYETTVDWEALLDTWGLAEKRETRFSQLSGGQKQRLFIAMALLNDPEIVFLDEITTGLDPQARHKTWDLVREIRAQGKTVVLVTHFMDEAQELCDRIAIIDHARLIALDTPQALIKNLEAEQHVTFSTPEKLDLAVLEALPEVRQVQSQNGTVHVEGRGALLVKVVLTLSELNITPTDFHLESASLEDVFLTLTGRPLRK